MLKCPLTRKAALLQTTDYGEVREASERLLKDFPLNFALFKEKR
jgi:hypothetical protein